MSKLDELIRELCPDGVESVPLWSVTIWDKKFSSVDRKKQPKIINYSYLLASDLFALQVDGGDVFLLSTGEQTGWTTKELASENLREGEVVTIPWGKSRPVTDCIKYYKGKFVTADNRIMTSNDTKKLNNKYLYYWIMSQGRVIDTFYRGSGIKHPDMAKVLDMWIPIPPLEIQCEIVRILDNFTNLTAELTAELTARKTQYNYYRNKLLSFDAQKSIRTAPLADIAEISTGSSNTDDAVEDGIYPFYVRSQEPLRKNEYEFDEEAIITAGDGVGVGKVFHYANGKYALHQRAYRIHPKDSELLGKYLYHYFVARFPGYIGKQMYQGSVPSIRRPMLNKFEVVIPPLEVQEKIAKILDNFDAICADLNIGLPAEIEARQKQYEYYRDKLLTFAETGNTILSRAEQSRAEQSRAEQSRAEQSRAEQSRAEQSRAEQSRALIKLLQYVFGYAVVTLEDIAENCDSMRKPVTSGKREAGEYPYYGASGIVDYVKDYIFDGDYLLVSEDGANLLARSTPIAFSISGKNWVNNHAHVLKFGCYETRRFVEFYLNSIDLTPYISGGAQPKLNQKNLNRIEIPLPSQERQKYIVYILDRFDAICNDLTSGLPAEIEARQKQYEYYRDKLLTFKEVAAT